MRIIVFLLFCLITISVKPQSGCNASTITPNNIYYAGPSYNITTFNPNAQSVNILCYNATVYDTTIGGDIIIMISAGAQYIWKPCGTVVSELYVKSGGTLNFKQSACSTFKYVYIEPGAIINDPFNAMAANTVTFSCSSLLFPNINCTTLLNEAFLENTIKFFPNPANEELNIAFNLQSNVEVNQILIYNSIGQLIREEEIIFKNNSGSINVTDLPNGVYYLNLKGVKKRFVITR